MIGTQVLHYQILEKLGEGGMGVVYKAQDTKLDRLVALKFLPPHLAASEQDKARFTQEAKAASSINHPNICTIYSIDEHDGQMFIVMEFVDGQTLRQKRESIGYKQAIDVGIQIADGLAAAHEKGIVHRDIKPENIMIRKDGIAQIMDFGLAKLRASGSKITRLTKEGSTVGTAGYMSPEQIQGQETDHRSDIFSYGVLLYELLTGQLPFKGVHETALAYEIVNVDPVPMSSVSSEIDPNLDAIVLECLEKDVNERAQGMRQVSVDLKKYKRESSRQRVSRITAARPAIKAVRQDPVPEPPGGSSGMRRFLWPAVVLLSILALSATLLALFTGRERTAGDVVKFDISLAPEDKLGQYLDISPDGKKIAYVAINKNASQVCIRDIGDVEAHALPGTEGANFVFFPAAGDWLGFEADGRLKKISLRGGSPVTICAVDNLRGADATGDNLIIFTPKSTSGLWRVALDGGAPQPLTTLDSSAGEINHRYPEILPGGKAVLFTVKTNSITKFSEAKIAVQKLDGTEKKILIEDASFAKYLPTGHILYGQGGSVFVVGFDPERLEVTGPPVRVLDGGMLFEGFGSMILGVSATGTLVYAPGGPLPQDSNAVLIYDRKGNAQPLISSPGPYASVAVSPDRQRLATYITSANDDIWLYDITRQLKTRFTFAGGNNWYPMWSRDGRHVVYTAERNSAPNLFWKSTDGNGTEERLASGPSVQFATSWSPDGKLLTFHQSNTKGDLDVWVLPMEGDTAPRPFLHTAFNESWASFSPDGRWLAYTSDESGQYEIYAVPYPAGNAKWQISIGGGYFPKWVKNSTEIIYINADNDVVSVPIDVAGNFRPGSANRLFHLPDSPLWAPDVSPDGEQIALVLPGKRLRLTKLLVVVNWFEELKKRLAENP